MIDDTMVWRVIHRAYPAGAAMADRHYNRQTIGSPQFVPPGRCFVLITDGALWVSSWPFPQFTKHRWKGAWINTLFRRESGPRASDLIVQAVAATRFHWGEPPELGMVTFVDATKVRHKRDPGRCYARAGFRDDGLTQGGLICKRLFVEDFPPAKAAIGECLSLFSGGLNPGTNPIYDVSGNTRAGLITGAAQDTPEPRRGASSSPPPADQMRRS